jgi:hypothetical protein
MHLDGAIKLKWFQSMSTIDYLIQTGSKIYPPQVGGQGVSVGSGVVVIVGDSVGGNAVFDGVCVWVKYIRVFVAVGVLLEGIFVFDGVIVAGSKLISSVIVGLLVFVLVEVFVFDVRSEVLVGVAVRVSEAPWLVLLSSPDLAVSLGEDSC